MQQDKFGIYLNTRDLKVVRINSPYWIPEGKDWVMVTTEVNATLVKIREVAAQKKLAADPGKIVWGEFPKLKE